MNNQKKIVEEKFFNIHREGKGVTDAEKDIKVESPICLVKLICHKWKQDY